MCFAENISKKIITGFYLKKGVTSTSLGQFQNTQALRNILFFSTNLFRA